MYSRAILERRLAQSGQRDSLPTDASILNILDAIAEAKTDLANRKDLKP
jgi:hypothetical protein